MGHVTRVPIACSLTATEAGDRMDEWRSFVAAHVDARAADDAGIRLRLRPGDDALLAAADLAEREKACCPFFTFAVEIDADGRHLRISGPPEADEVVADFAARLVS